ncbi:MAG: acyl-[acyl-carrier-protein] thioesterase [Candidatus Cryptobacteroides sp.]
MNDNKFTQRFVIPCYDTDSQFRLRPSSFMDFAQEIANCHATALGFGYDDLMRTRTVWVLSRMHIHFDEYPKWRDEVVLKTWHKGRDGLFWLRDFGMEAADGRSLVRATTSWLVLNIDTRHISRDTAILDEGTACSENAIERACDKLSAPKDTARTGMGFHKVTYSDVDMNSHTNNAKYLQWVTDALGYDFMTCGDIRDIKINFNGETRPGETVSMFRSDSPDGTICIDGTTEDGRSAFRMEISR